MSSQSLISWFRHPASILLIIVLVILLVIMSEQSRQAATSQPLAAIAPSTMAPTAIQPPAKFAPPGGTAPSMGGELPKIVNRLNASTANPPARKPAGVPGRLQAPDLGSLLGRLEDKVKADPSDINNRLLLAQTYNELGLGDKALTEVRAALAQAPDHGRAQLVLGSILSSRQDDAGLQEAKTLLSGLQSRDDIKQYLVAMYLGDTFIRLGDHAAALANWKQALDNMPVTDNRRSRLEKRIAELSAKGSDAG
jgi:tetratricopeptide (TPR) repeat protein